MCLCLELPAKPVEHGDLRLIGPAQHVPAAVVDAVPVVLLVSLVAFDLARHGDCTLFAHELLVRLTAGDVGASGQLSLEPSCDGCRHALVDLELVE